MKVLFSAVCIVLLSLSLSSVNSYAGDTAGVATEKSGGPLQALKRFWRKGVQSIVVGTIRSSFRIRKMTPPTDWRYPYVDGICYQSDNNTVYFTSDRFIYALSLTENAVISYAGSANPKSLNQFEHRLSVRLGQNMHLACGRGKFTDRATKTTTVRNVLFVSDKDYDNGPDKPKGRVLKIPDFGAIEVVANADAIVEPQGLAVKSARDEETGQMLSDVLYVAGKAPGGTSPRIIKVALGEKAAPTPLAASLSCNTSTEANPYGLALGPTGLLYASLPTKGCIVEIDPSNGTARKVANEDLGQPYGIAMGEDGALYGVDYLYCLVKRVDPVSGATSVVAGKNSCGSSPIYEDDQPASATQLAQLYNLAAGPSGQLYLSVKLSHRVLSVYNDETGTRKIKTLAGRNLELTEAEKNPASVSAARAKMMARDVAVASDGTINFADLNANSVRQIPPVPTPNVLAVPITQDTSGSRDIASVPTSTPAPGLSDPRAIALGFNDRIYVADTNNNTIRTVPDGQVIAGTGMVNVSVLEDADPLTANLKRPELLAVRVDNAAVSYDTIFLVDQNASGHKRLHKLYKPDPSADLQKIRTLIDKDDSTKLPYFSVEGKQGCVPLEMYPSGLAVGPNGELYVSDADNNKIWKLTEVNLACPWRAESLSLSKAIIQPGKLTVDDRGMIFVITAESEGHPNSQLLHLTPRENNRYLVTTSFSPRKNSKDCNYGHIVRTVSSRDAEKRFGADLNNACAGEELMSVSVSKRCINNNRLIVLSQRPSKSLPASNIIRISRRCY